MIYVLLIIHTLLLYYIIRCVLCTSANCCRCADTTGLSPQTFSSPKGGNQPYSGKSSPSRRSPRHSRTKNTQRRVCANEPRAAFLCCLRPAFSLFPPLPKTHVFILACLPHLPIPQAAFLHLAAAPKSISTLSIRRLTSSWRSSRLGRFVVFNSTAQVSGGRLV